MLEFKSYLRLIETQIPFPKNAEQLATDLFQSIVSLSDPDFAESEFLTFNPRLAGRFLKKSRRDIDLYVLPIPIEEIYNTKLEKFLVTKFSLAKFGHDKRFEYKPYVKIFLLKDFDPNNSMHVYIAKKYFSKDEIWQALIHELTHLSDTEAEKYLRHEKLEDEEELLTNLEFRANINNLINFCDKKQIDRLLLRLSPRSIPICIQNSKRLHTFVLELLATESGKEKLSQGIKAAMETNRLGKRPS